MNTPKRKITNVVLKSKRFGAGIDNNKNIICRNKSTNPIEIPEKIIFTKSSSFPNINHHKIQQDNIKPTKNLKDSTKFNNSICSLPINSQVNNIIPNNNLLSQKTAQYILNSNRSFRHLDKNMIDNIITKKLDNGFLNENPNVLIPLKDIKSRKNISTSKIKKNKKVLESSYTPNNDMKYDWGMEKIAQLQKSKILIANMSKSKRKSIFGIQEANKNNNSLDNNIKTSGRGLHLQGKKFSLLEQFIVKLVDRDEVLEDFVMDSKKPFDRYTRFKRQCIKEQKRVFKVVEDMNSRLSMNDKLLKTYITKLKFKFLKLKKVKH